MKIENNTLSPNFGRAYIDMQSLCKYGKSFYHGNGRSKIVSALKEKNTPLRKFIKEVINTPKFEKEYGDVFISFNRQRHFCEGEDLFDMVNFKFPKIMKGIDRECVIDEFENQTTYHAGFRDFRLCYSGQDGANELQKYLSGHEIVEDLKWHINKLHGFKSL